MVDQITLIVYGLLMFLTLTRSDDDGQFAPSISVEIKHFSIHGFESNGGVWFDITYMVRRTVFFSTATRHHFRR
jgi:hypothetical protein